MRAGRLLVGAISLALGASMGGPARGAPLGAGDRASAEGALTALYVDPFADDPFAVLERIYPRGGRLDGLIQQCAANAGKSAPDAAEQIVLGRLLFAAGRRAEGAAVLARAAKASSLPPTQFRLGKLLEMDGDRKPAIEAYQRASGAADPALRRNALLRLGSLLLAEHRTPEALTAYDEARRVAPRDGMMRQQIAEQLAAARQYQPALDELQAIEPLVARDPQATMTLLRRRAEIYRKMGQQQREADTLIHAFVQAPSSPSTVRTEILNALLRSFHADAQHGKETRNKGFARLLEASGRAEAASPAAALLTAEVHAAQSDAATALETFQRAAADPVNQAYALRRIAALSRGDERVGALRRLFALEPGDAILGLDLVGALLDAGAPDAIASVELLRRRFANNPTVLGELQERLRRHGRDKEALAVAEQVVAADPTNDAAYVAYADALLAAGRKPEAAKALRHAIDRDPTLARYRQLVEALAERHLDGQVRVAYEEAEARYHDKLMRRDYARWLGASGDLDGAMKKWVELRDDRSVDPFLRDLASHEITRLERQRAIGR